MAINPQIPLTGNASLMPGINALSQGIDRRRERELQQTKLDQSQEALDIQRGRAETAAELTELQIDRLNQQIAATDKEEAFAEVAKDALEIRSALATGGTEAALALANARKARLIERMKTDKSVNTIHTDRLLAALNESPEAAAVLLDREISDLTRQGFIGKDGATAKPSAPIKVKGPDGRERLVFATTGPDGVSLTMPELPDGFEIVADGDDKSFDQETKLRKEYLSESKDFIKTRDAHTRVIASAEDPSPAGDLALIFNYMKVLDPGSTVREGEFATAQTAGSVPTRVWSLYNQVMEGTRLTASQRGDFTTRSQKLFDAGLKNQTSLVDRYQDLAKRNNLAPENVVIQFRLPGQAEQQPITKDDLSDLTDDELRRLLEQIDGS
jgi:hypothetical protein